MRTFKATRILLAAAVAVGLLATRVTAAPILGAVDEFDGTNEGWVSSLGNVSGLGESGGALAWSASFPGVPISEVWSDTSSQLIDGGDADWTALGAQSISFDFTAGPSLTSLEIMFRDSADFGFWRYDFGAVGSGTYEINLTFGSGWYYDAGGSSEANFNTALASVDFVGLAIGGLSSGGSFTLDNVTLNDAPAVVGVGGPVPEPSTYAALAMVFLSLATGFRGKIREGLASIGVA